MRLTLILVYCFCFNGNILGQEIQSFLNEVNIKDTLNIKGYSVISNSQKDSIVFSLQAIGRKESNNQFRQFEKLKLSYDDGVLKGWSLILIDNIAYIESRNDKSIAKIHVDSLSRSFPLTRVLDLPYFNHEQLSLLEKDSKTSFKFDRQEQITNLTIISKDSSSVESLEYILNYNMDKLISYHKNITSTIGNQTHIIEINHFDALFTIDEPNIPDDYKFYDLTTN